MDESFDVVVVGGGVAGLWLVKELASCGCRCAVIDELNYASYSSTRNQGWVQRGALYANSGQPSVALACAAGARKIAREAPDAIHEDVACYFLLDEGDARFIENCQRLGIAAERVPASRTRIAPGMLRNSPVRVAVETHDRPIDTHALLRTIRNAALRMGTRMHAVKSVGGVKLDRRTNDWEVRTPEGQRIQARCVVLTCGVLIPAILAQVLSHPAHLFDRTRIGVLAAQDMAMSSMMLLGIPGRQWPNCVPYRTPAGVGTTICIAGADEPLTDVAVSTPTAQEQSRYADIIRATLPELHARLFVNTPRPKLHWHSCQKINLHDSTHRGRILIDHGDAGVPGLFTYYPGKFTSSPISAEECADLVLRHLGKAWPVSRQPYVADAGE